MATICDIEDPCNLYEAAGDDFSALLRDLAREHGRLKMAHERLLAGIEHEHVKDFLSGEQMAHYQEHPYSSEHATLREPVVLDVGTEAVLAKGVIVEEIPQTAASRAEPRTQTFKLMDLHHLWKQSEVELAETKHRKPSRQLTVRPSDDAIRGGDTLREKAFMQRFIIGPNNMKRTFWDILSVVILSIDIVMVPMIVFDIPDTPALRHMSLTCTAFWTFDIVASFLTGFHVEGQVEMRPSQVFKKYIRGWFVFDLIVVLVDWLLLVLSSGLAAVVGVLRVSKLLRFGRILRALRLVRLLRMVKMPSLLDEVHDIMWTDNLTAAFKILKSLLAIAVANHFLACGWYAVGKASSPSWIDKLDVDGRKLSFRYASALHWSLTQFTPASMEIYPRSLPERVYSICVLFLALVVFSSFVSSITSSMTHLRQIRISSSRQRRNLRKYIQENKLSLELTNCIMAFVRHLHVRARARVHENEVDAFKVLPESLKLQLHWEVYIPILSPHPFFYHAVEFFESFILELSHSSLSERSLTISQELFSQGQEAKEMYFAVSGSLEYYRGRTDIRTDMVNQGQWCSEIALWLMWVRGGQLTALSHCELVVLDASAFRKLVSRSTLVFGACKAYALAFQEQVSHWTKDMPLDTMCDHDTTLEMSQLAFAPVRHQHQSQMKHGNTERSAGRSWPISLLRHILTPKPGFQASVNRVF